MTKALKLTFLTILVLTIIMFLVQCIFNKDVKPDLTIQNINYIQLEEPAEGQEIAIFKTSLGEFRAVLYREQAPKTVEHFVNLANLGYYNDKYVFLVESGVFFFAGTTDDKGNIVAKEDENYDEEITVLENEVHPDLWPFKGSLISLAPNYSYQGGTFFGGINTMEFSEEFIKSMRDLKDVNNELVDKFLEIGGVPGYSQIYTVFGQVYEGMDVFEAISNLPVIGEVDGEEKKYPAEPFKIESVTISTYIKK